MTDDDRMFTNLTVAETLTFSAELRLSSDIPLSEKKQLVDKLIMQLGLNNCKNTFIGDPEARGISGGERKRVSVGIELITDPKILFLDEPTSGLDSFNALNIVQTLKQLAISENKLMLMTIHQPRTDILEQFDKIILLSAGKLVWYGKTEGKNDYEFIQ
jgi:ABC-type multidrug transport system ATPase subunit